MGDVECFSDGAFLKTVEFIPEPTYSEPPLLDCLLMVGGDLLTGSSLNPVPQQSLELSLVPPICFLQDQPTLHSLSYPLQKV